MNRDYGAWVEHQEPPQKPVEKVETVDYYVPVCSHCQRPDDLCTVDVGGLLMYAHYTCFHALLDNLAGVR